MLNKIVAIIVLSIALQADWNEYKNRFIQSDGRVIDKKNKNITHSEGIGYTLYFAYKFDDDKTFDLVYRWYGDNLPKNSFGLVSWKWGEDKENTWRTLDSNNATDGDLWIAYSLLLMAEKRQDLHLREEALSLMDAVKQHLIVRQKKRLFLLPGKEGFQKKEEIVVNPSYYRFDIFQAFAKEDPDGPWRELEKDGEWLLHQANFTPLNLPADWISIDENLTICPARNKRFGYDAIRIPLNILQSTLPTKRELLLPYQNYVEMMKIGDQPFGVVGLEKGVIHLYDYNYGHLAIYDKLLPQPIFAEKLQTLIQDDEEDYYAYALYLFTTLN